MPDAETPNRVAHVHHYVLKGSGLSHYAECDATVEDRWDSGAEWRTCAHKLAGDNGPIVGSKNAVERAIEAAR